VAAARAHSLPPGAKAVSTRAGRLGNVMIRGDEVRLGRCHIASRENLDSFD
jgi:hypothetical protein